MPATDRPGRTFLDRFGATIVRGGIAPVPSTIYFYQAELGLSPQEVWFVGYILAHKWDEDLPHPSLVKMATRVGLSSRQLHRIKGGLAAKGFLSCVPRHRAAGGKDTNGYDFSGLFGRLEDLIRTHGPRGECPVLPPDEDAHVMSQGDGTPTSHRDATPTSHREGNGTHMSHGAATPTSHRARTPTSHRAATPPSQSTVTRTTQPHRTPTSHDSEADHSEPKQAEPKHVKPKHADPPPPPPSYRRPPPPRSKVVEVVEVVEPFNQVKYDTNLLVKRMGLDEETALRYARLARRHGRPSGYVAELIEHALTDPEVRNPLKVVAKNITANVRRSHPNGLTGGARLSGRRPTGMTGPASPRRSPPLGPRPTPFATTHRARPAAALDPDDEIEPEEAVEAVDYGPMWQSAQAVLRLACQPDEYERAARYVQLLEIDRERGWALLGAPNAHVRDEVQTQLTVPFQMALERACGTRLKLLVVVRSPQKTLRLADLLAAQTDTSSAETKGATPVPSVAVEQPSSRS